MSVTERVTTAARPPSSGCAYTTSGCANLTPLAAGSKRRKNGDASASGCAAEHTSCRKPGSVSSSVRQPPPGLAAPSITCTRSPAAASVTAAARPFGPLPTTMASASPGMGASWPRRDGRAHHPAWRDRRRSAVTGAASVCSMLRSMALCQMFLAFRHCRWLSTQVLRVST